MPPSALSHLTASCMLGVGQTPRSTTSQPAASSPARTAERIIGPDGRVSRQTRIRPRSRYVPKLSANSTASSGVKVSPTMPRTPVMPIFSGFIELLGLNLFRKLGLSDLIVHYDRSNSLHQKVETTRDLSTGREPDLDRCRGDPQWPPLPQSRRGGHGGPPLQRIQ